MIMISLVTICCHIKILYNYWLYYLQCTFHTNDSLILQLEVCTSWCPSLISLLPLWQPPVCSLYFWLCHCFVMFVHLFCFFYILHISEITQYLAFSDLFYLALIPSRFIHLDTNGKISFSFYSWVVFNLSIPYPFIYWWTPRLLLYLGYCK